MKKLLHATLFLPLFGLAQTAQVHIAGAEYPVIFADTNLLPTAMQRIATDLTVVFSPALSFEEAKGRGLDAMVKATVPLPGGGTSITNINGVGRWAGAFKPSLDKTLFSEEEEGFFIVDYDNQKSVQVSKVASSNYVHAFKLMDAHSNAVQKAYAFAVMLKTTDWSTQPIQALKGLHHMTPEDRDAFNDDYYRTFAEEMQQHVTLGITALGFSLKKRPEVGDKIVLVYGSLLLYYDGRWGFGKYW